METTLSQQLARNVRAELARAGVSQTALAAAMSLSQSAVNRRLQGATDWTVVELQQVADTLGLPLSAFIPDAYR
jgi:transcriptional regulator with XRE-family HTH domain